MEAARIDSGCGDAGKSTVKDHPVSYAVARLPPMSGRWGVDRVTALAPDSGSEVAGRKLARPGPWSDVGWADPLLWGSCQGSGKTPYAVAVDVSGPTYKCSCPSHKFPCKHVLGLLFLWAEGGIGEGGQISAHAAEWSAKRAMAAAPKAEPASAEKTQAQIEAAAARAAARDEKVANGLAELDLWLADQVTAGLAMTRPEAASRLAARMVDAQAPGVAGRLRALAELPQGGRWLEEALETYGMLHLLATATAQVAALPEGLRQTVRQHVGYPTPRESVEATAPVTDRWAVIGMRDSDEEQVSTRRVWLWGLGTGIPALVLFFTPYGQAVDSSLLPGTAVDAALHFYPGQPRLRALVGVRTGEHAAAAWPAPGGTVADAVATWRRVLAEDPWLGEYPVAVAGRVGADAVVDDAGDSVAISGGDRTHLLALTGGHPTTVLGEISRAGLLPTAVVLDGQVVPL